MKAVIGFGEIKEILRSEKGIRIIFIAGAALILLIAFSGISGRSGSSSASDRSVSEQFTEYEKLLEERLTAILSEIEGVGNVRVMVTLDTSEHTEYGRSADMRVSVTAPEVRGVIVVCDGGNSITVKQKVTEAVMGVFNINSLHISVIR